MRMAQAAVDQKEYDKTIGESKQLTGLYPGERQYSKTIGESLTHRIISWTNSNHELQPNKHDHHFPLSSVICY